MKHIPDNWYEAEPGIWKIRKHKKATATTNKKRYLEQITDSLEADKGHYNRLLNKPGFSFLKDLTGYGHVMSVGGGFPKLESLIPCATHIEVCDLLGEEFQKRHRLFAQKFGPLPDVEYRTVDITHSQFDPHAELVCFVHLLEHLSLVQVRRLLGNTKGDILIYGPNIEAAKPRWWHFCDPYHRTMLTRGAMRKELEGLGYEIKQDLAYCDDYLIFATK